jgi:glycosyltransferase involved in cell wall biosynthesis
MGLSIDVYCNDGSPLGVIPEDIEGRGVGGAELAMLTWAETMAGRGHRVRIYNDPRVAGIQRGVEFLPQRTFAPGDARDVFIVYRSPNPFVRIAKAAIRVHWSLDQHTIGNYARDIFPWVDRVVCISPFHMDYHRRTYGIADGKIGYLDLGVRLADYDQDIERIAGRCIFCSVPDRGLDILRVLWPMIKEKAPHASLVITSDYRLWGAPAPLNHQYRLAWLHLPDVAFLGKVERSRLVQEQLAAEVMSYPCTYEELFCISAAECQVAGAIPVTSDYGALPTTNAWGTALPGNVLDGGWQRGFVEAVAAAMDMQPIERARAQTAARQRFDWNRIAGQWEHLFETGEFPA